MPTTLETMKELYDRANPEDKEKYLFAALIELKKVFCEKLNEVHAEMKSVKDQCACRERTCSKMNEEKFVTKKQAKIFGILLVALVAGIAIGGGVLTWKEILMRSLPHILR